MVEESTTRCNMKNSIDFIHPPFVDLSKPAITSSNCRARSASFHAELGVPFMVIPTGGPIQYSQYNIPPKVPQLFITMQEYIQQYAKHYWSVLHRHDITDQNINALMELQANRSTKGQLISKGLFGVIVLTKKTKKIFKDFYPSLQKEFK